MKSEDVLQDIRARIVAGYPLLFLKTAEEDRWERELAELALEMEHGIVTWTATQGLQPPPTGEHNQTSLPGSMLTSLRKYPEDHLFLVKDFHPYLSDPLIIRQIRDLLPELIRQQKTLLIFGPVADVPFELQKDCVTIELPLPAYEDLRDEFDSMLTYLRERKLLSIKLSDDDEDRLIKGVLGLSVNEARKAWQRALINHNSLNDQIFTTLIAEKRTLASGSAFLEFYDLQ